MKKVTVVIQTYNRPEYLPVAIRSVLNQTCQDFEIIIFDSGSNYDVAGQIAAFNDPRIKLQKSEKKISGQNNFERTLTFKYETEYLIIFHDDDAMHPQLIERELKLMEQYPDLVWVGTSLNFINDRAQMNNFQLLGEFENFNIYNRVELIRLILHNFDLNYNTVMYRISLMDNADTVYSRYNKWADRPRLVQLSEKGKVAIIKEKLVNYRIHSGQDSKTDDRTILPYLLNLFNYYRDNLPTPLSVADKKLFYTWSSNHLIASLASFSRNIKEYFNLLKECRHNNLFKIKYLNFRGFFYFFKVMIKFIKQYAKDKKIC